MQQQRQEGGEALRTHVRIHVHTGIHAHTHVHTHTYIHCGATLPKPSLKSHSAGSNSIAVAIPPEAGGAVSTVEDTLAGTEPGRMIYLRERMPRTFEG